MKKQSVPNILDEMMDEFTNSSTNLLSVSQRFIHEVDNRFLYGVIIAKMSRRMAAALSIDREIVVIFSNFEEQQSRTVKTVLTIISEMDVRLEPTLAVIVHKDRRGNDRLKNWGRQSGITILPIYLDQQLPINDDLERLLCVELYSHDLFDITGPVSDDTQFYGRRTEAQDIARKLQLGQIKAILGIRKIGKTSVVNRIIDNLAKYHDSIGIMLDCSRDDIWEMQADQLMLSICRAIETAITENRNYVIVSSVRESSTISATRDAMIDLIVTSDKAITVFLDEVDYITPGSPTNNDWANEFNKFWRNFRVVYQEVARSQQQNFSILVSGVSSKWFSVPTINGIENAALLFVPEEYLSPLPRGATVSMIRKMGRISGLIFDKETADFVAHVAADMPFWVRKACSYIHRNIAVDVRPFEIDMKLTERLLNDFVESEGTAIAEVAIRHLFRVYPELGPVAHKFFENPTSEQPKAILEKLRRYGLLTLQMGKYMWSGNMIRQGLLMYLEQQRIDRDLVAIPNYGLEVNSLGEWADELAIINRRRNLLEKNLRQIVLNFIRYDSMKNKSKGTSIERIKSVLPEKEHSKLSNLSVDQVIEKLTWLQLISIINREWPIFDSVFGDKKAFENNCSIINERFDAHAKDVDTADLALYRRSLKQLEEAIAKM